MIRKRVVDVVIINFYGNDFDFHDESSKSNRKMRNIYIILLGVIICITVIYLYLLFMS